MHELLTSEADINKERHAPHRYHTTMMASARSEVWREIPIVWRAITRLARRRSIRSVATTGRVSRLSGL